MNDLNTLRKAFAKFKQDQPQQRGYPEELWAQVVALAQKHSPEFLAEKLGIGASNIRRHMERMSTKPPQAQLVPLQPHKEISPQQIQTLEISLPNGLHIKIYQ